MEFDVLFYRTIDSNFYAVSVGLAAMQTGLYDQHRSDSSNNGDSTALT